MSDTEEIPLLPALKGLGKLADLRPVVVIDTREQDPLPIYRLKTVRAGLKAADYSFLGGEDIFGTERKSVADLVSCCVNSNRERFFWELHRLGGYKFRRLLVVGTREEIAQGNYRSQLPPKAVFSTLSAIEARFGVPVVFAATATEAALLVESWVFWSARELVVACNTLLRANMDGLDQEDGR